MTISSVSLSRTTTSLTASSLLSVLRKTQVELFKAQNAIATGIEVNRPSDAPARTSSILVLQSRLEARDQHEVNLQAALSSLNNADESLSQISDILLEAKSIALSQVGIGSNKDTRANQAAVIDAQLKALLDIANRSHNGVKQFAGDAAPLGSTQDPFVEFLGGVRYLGSRSDLEVNVGLRDAIGLNANGHDAFGALSTRVEGTVDLDPRAVASVNLRDVLGAQGVGVREGSLLVTVNGTQAVVDLADADTLGDVATRVNEAIDSVLAGAGGLALSGAGFALTASAGNTITIAETGTGGQTAGDLGLLLTATSSTVNGEDLHTQLSLSTALSDLGVSVDLVSGIKITQGSQTKVADFSSATTIQDLVNAVDALGLGVRLEINADRNGLNLVSEVSGLVVSLGENAGGSTATDLGLRSFSRDTLLADFNFGIGVHNVQGEPDFRLELHDGTQFDIDLDALVTVGDVIDAISAAAAGAGLTVGAPGSAGTDFNVGLASDGNGLVFEDNTLGGAEFKVTQLFTSLAATDLGIYKNAQAGGTIAGDDKATIRSDSVFTHLMLLRDALLNDDSRGIVFAGDGIDKDIDELARVRADIGVRSQRVEQEQDRSQQMKVTEQSMLSDLRDADVTEVITRFTQLQQQLQATLQVGSANLQLSFLDFLR